MRNKSYAGAGTLVGTASLESRLDEDVTAYEKGHIPGAIAWNWNVDLKAEVGWDFIDQAGLTALLRAGGVNDDTTVVLYGSNNNRFAAYAYWLMKYLGFDSVKLLDGGRKRWELESRMLTDEVPTFSLGNVSLSTSVRSELRAIRNQVLSRIGHAAFIDVRSPEEYRGELLAPPHLPQEQAQVSGHVPGAAKFTWSKAANDDGTFSSADELRALYEGVGITPDREVITYWRIGERSSHTWFVLHELLGYPDVKNYDGSWTEYGSLVGEPVEKG